NGIDGALLVTAVFAGVVGAGVWGAAAAAGFANCRLKSELVERLALFRMESSSTSAKKAMAVYLVNLVSAVPEPAPNNASVAPPPKATPTPASFLGNWISTSKPSKRQSMINIGVRIQI